MPRASSSKAGKNFQSAGRLETKTLEDLVAFLLELFLGEKVLKKDWFAVYGTQF